MLLSEIKYTKSTLMLLKNQIPFQSFMDFRPISSLTIVIYIDESDSFRLASRKPDERSSLLVQGHSRNPRFVLFPLF